MESGRVSDFIKGYIPDGSEELKVLRDKAEKNGVPIIRKETEAFLVSVLMLKKPERILELGTATGYSAMLMARTMERYACNRTAERDTGIANGKLSDASIDTIEDWEPRFIEAKTNIEKACMADMINLIQGDALQIMKELDGSYDFIFIDGNCVEECPNNLFLTSEKECVESCPNGTYEFTFNYTCLESCPNNYEINKNKCAMKSVDNSISSEEFKSQLKENLKAFTNSSELINGSDFIAIITSDNMDPKEQLKKGISAIDLGNCTQVIKDYYNISDNESLIIMNMESKKTNEKSNDNSFNLGKNNQIEIYDISGKKLELSVCKEDIKIMKYLGDVGEELDIDSAKSFADSGVDVFNASDEFFNDLCYEYERCDALGK